jgi:hypothetical protein
MSMSNLITVLFLLVFSIILNVFFFSEAIAAIASLAIRLGFLGNNLNLTLAKQLFIRKKY